ncbi:MAG: polyphosphate kinase 2 family protein [Bacteroidia bacterium]|nr:polyphosphate kinase 2 family protein [Bacteroidia bacterium]
MKKGESRLDLKDYLVKPGKKFRLKDFDTGYKKKTITKQESLEMLESGLKELSETQDKLYAHNQYSILIILQAMDAAGKDGAVKHIMTGFNPLGVKVYSFKAPNSHELDHDYFWRHELALPARGEIAIHNRSHYENVLVTKVHPEFIMSENIPDIDSVHKIDKKFWEKRYKQIRRFEKNLTDNGTIILKFFLNVSKKEQKKRFLERIDDTTKNWKFSMADLRERGFWDEYQKAYEECMFETATDTAPWFVIPADDKWYARLSIAYVIYKEFEKLKLSYPIVSETQRAELQKAKAKLMSEEGGKAEKPQKPKKK